MGLLFEVSTQVAEDNTWGLWHAPTGSYPDDITGGSGHLLSAAVQGQWLVCYPSEAGDNGALRHPAHPNNWGGSSIK